MTVTLILKTTKMTTMRRLLIEASDLKELQKCYHSRRELVVVRRTKISLISAA